MRPMLRWFPSLLAQVVRAHGLLRRIMNTQITRLPKRSINTTSCTELNTTNLFRQCFCPFQMLICICNRCRCLQQDSSVEKSNNLNGQSSRPTAYQRCPSIFAKYIRPACSGSVIIQPSVVDQITSARFVSRVREGCGQHDKSKKKKQLLNICLSTTPNF